jgi:hypothetical protein
VKAFATIVFLMMVGFAFADEKAWPKLLDGDVRVLEDIQKIPPLVLSVAGDQQKRQFTFFRTPHGNDFVIINPCCGAAGKGSTLFQYEAGALKPVALVMGDPRLGFTAQGQAGDIKIAPDATSIRAFVYHANCEDGIWTYYYRFDEGDKLTLLSVIDTSCTHLGVREFYRAKNIDLGHWWMK